MRKRRDRSRSRGKRAVTENEEQKTIDQEDDVTAPAQVHAKDAKISNAKQCSSLSAYFIWLCCNLFWPGSHHYYLGRDMHCWMMMATFGGCGIGWLRDFIRIPAYVADYNGQPSPFSWFPTLHLDRICGLFFVGIWFGIIASGIPPVGYGTFVYIYAGAVGSSLGIYACGFCLTKLQPTWKMLRSALVWESLAISPFYLLQDESDANSTVRRSV